MELKAGQRLASAVCDTEVVVVKAPAADVDLRCGGHPMTPKGEPAPSAELDDAAQRRHADRQALRRRGRLGLEVLCTKAGAGSLSIGVDALLQKDAKPLPSSD